MSGAASICPRYHHAVELIGRRWAGAIIRGLLDGRARYNELRATIPDISDRMLTERLRELELEGVIVRTVVPASPVRVEYELTAKGRGLEDAVTAIEKWSTRWITDADLLRAGSEEQSRPAAPSAVRKRSRGRARRGTRR